MYSLCVDYMYNLSLQCVVCSLQYILSITIIKSLQSIFYSLQSCLVYASPLSSILVQSSLDQFSLVQPSQSSLIESSLVSPSPAQSCLAWPRLVLSNLIQASLVQSGCKSKSKSNLNRWSTVSHLLCVVYTQSMCSLDIVYVFLVYAQSMVYSLWSIQSTTIVKSLNSIVYSLVQSLPDP